ncbi:MAG: nickel-dependent lactate racemase, partial [Planctomycetota bacterium]|nr:nickel-dependent lactate racemase [Planctomycetota bacterium]
MRIDIGIGSSTQPVDVPDKQLLGVLRPNQAPVGIVGPAAVARALREPIESPPLRELVGPGEKIAIITSDITRPLPSYQVLPAVLDELAAAGVDMNDVVVVFALGVHRKHTEGEMRRLVGDASFERVRCLDGDPADAVHLGVTGSGTPVDIARPVAEADKRIGLGNIEYHYFAGYSGGAKAIMPGVSTRAAIQANHSRMVLPEAAAGRLEDNPLRLDIEEAMRFCPLHFIVNVVLNEKKEIIRAVAGHHRAAHREGCRFLDSLYRVGIRRRADIVIASQGGFPKDINLYQTQKALDNAKHAVRDGGIIILAGSCREGLGEDVFEEWMLGADSPSSLITRIQADFQLGGHKAAAIAMVLQRSEVYLVSDLEPEFVRRLFFSPYPTVQEAFAAARRKIGADASVIVMPYGG